MRWTGSAARPLAVVFGVLLPVSVSTHAGMAVGLTVRVPTDVGPREYVVQPGDTLWGIAASELGDPYRWPAVAAASASILQPGGLRLVDPDLIRPGWTLTLPTDRGQGSRDSEDRFSLVRLGASVKVLSGLALNNAGQVAGSDASDGDSDRAFRWDPRIGIQELGVLGEDGWSNAQDINEHGQVVGAASKYPEEEAHAFVWDAVAGKQDLGAVGGYSVGATVINERGLISGTSADEHGTLSVFRWDPAIRRLELESLVFADRAIINEKGQVALTTNQEAFRWDPDDGMQSLGDLGDQGGQAHAINDRGQVVGTSPTTTDEWSQPFLWDPVTGIQDLGIGGGGDIDFENVGYEMALNERGQVAGTAARIEDEVWVTYAWLWDPDTGMKDLGDLGSGQGAMVTDINERGQVIGTSNTAGHYQAWLWDPVTGRVDLSAPGDPDSTASAINDRGQVAGWSGTIAWEIEDDHTGEQEVGDAVLWTPAGT